MRVPANWVARSLCAVCCFGLTALVAGCGGGDSEPSASPSPTVSPTPRPTPAATPTPAPTRARVTIAWPARTRVEAVSSALSARIVLTGAAPGGGDVTWTAERPAVIPNQQPSLDYTSNDVAVAGTPFLLTVTFYGDANQTGGVVAVAQANATVRADGTLDTTIATVGTIRSVSVVPNQTVAVGQTVPLAFSALDATGNVIAVRPGSARISIAIGADRIALDGESIRGVRPRDASVVVAIDQASSSATPVIVTSDAVLTANTTGLNLSLEKSFAVTTTVTGTGVSDTGVTYALVNPPANVAITPAGLLTVGKNEGTFQIVATSVYDTAKTLTIPVTVASKVVTAIINTPTPVRVGIGDKVAITATVSDPDGAPSDTSVTWAVIDPVTGRPITTAGTIDADGVYTAPTTAGTYRILATSRYDTRKTDFVNVSVVAGGVGVIIQ
ncbi:MAG: hypothetical protein H7Y38_09515 [Armatimonadetes bacterium]|nr:hypothetical protein [Armatimonadota bacterium]